MSDVLRKQEKKLCSTSGSAWGQRKGLRDSEQNTIKSLIGAGTPRQTTLP